MIQLKNIFKWVNTGANRTFLLKDINLEIKEGEFVSIMGPSGSGKSTLLNVIGMLDGFDEGEYNFFNESVHKLKEKQRSQLYKEYIGFVFQAYHLIDELTVYENIETPLLYQRCKIIRKKSLGGRHIRPVQHCWQKRFVPHTTKRRAATVGRHCKGINRQAKIVIGR